jgi:protoporphyrinogen oxidase
MRTGIIGGGITGLTVAYRLAERGEKVTVIERGGELGGLAGCFRIGGVRLEKYFHHIFLSDRAVRDLIREVGLEPDLFWRVTPMGFYAGGKTHPFDGPLDLLRFPPLSPIDRLRFGWRVLQAGRNPDGLSLDATPVRSWVENTWGGEIYARFWKPLLTAKFGDAADEISAAWLWGRLYARANSRSGTAEKLGYLRGGFSRLLDAMAERIRSGGSRILRGSPVSRVEREPSGGWNVSTRHGNFTFDRVVLAVPSPIAAALVKGLPEAEHWAHTAIPYQGVICMTVVMKEPLGPIYWINVGDRTIPYAGVIEQTNLVPCEDYGGRYLAYLFNYLPPTHPWMSEPRDSLFLRYEEGLRRMFPTYKRDHVVRTALFRDLHATPIYGVNYLKKIPRSDSDLPGLYFANTAQIFPHDRNMNHSVELAGKLIGRMSEGAA